MYVRGLTHFLSVQDEVLTVIRRVDENWAEGMLGDKIGIFPILYVEVNTLHTNTHAHTHTLREKLSHIKLHRQSCRKRCCSRNTCITVFSFIIVLYFREPRQSTFSSPRWKYTPSTLTRNNINLLCLRAQIQTLATTLMINLYIGAVWLPHRSPEWKPAYSDAFRERRGERK